MKKSLLSKIDSFSKLFFEGLSIYEKVQSKAIGDVDFNKNIILWDQFLNNLISDHPEMIMDSSKKKEKKLSISYDFITDADYHNHPVFCRDEELRKMQIALLSNHGVLLVGENNI